jgi:hypothetical protein
MDPVGGGVLYVNGVARDTTAALTPTANGDSLYFGMDYIGTSLRNLAGSLDDIRLATRAYSAGEVRQLYQESQRPFSTLLTWMSLPFGATTAVAGILRQQLLQHGG